MSPYHPPVRNFFLATLALATMTSCGLSQRKQALLLDKAYETVGGELAIAATAQPPILTADMKRRIAAADSIVYPLIKDVDRAATQPATDGDKFLELLNKARAALAALQVELAAAKANNQ